MLNIEELDHEFLTEGSPDAEGERVVGLAQQNLSKEEIQRILELIPAVKEYQLYMIKAETGEFPEGAEEFFATNGQEMPLEEGRDIEVPQNSQMQEEVPLQAVEEEVPKVPVEMAQNVPEMAPNQNSIPQMRLGDVVPEQPEQPALAPIGTTDDMSGIMAEPRADNSGVSDDITKTVDEGDFVINKAAVDEAGIADIIKMIEDAGEKRKELIAKGTIEGGDETDNPQNDTKMQIKISNGEARIKKSLVNIIGTDKLTKINNRGLAKTEEKLKEQGAPKEGSPTPERSVGENALRPEILQGNKGGLVQKPKNNLKGQMSGLT
jgi:hypothetical protein